jgi:hypothetical protein
MPSSARHKIKRKLEYCKADVVNALLMLDDVYNIYFPNYPDLAQRVDFMRQILRDFIVIITAFDESV